MRTRTISGAVIAVSVGALLLAGGAVAGKKPAKTTVTIEAQSGGFFGYVSSKKPNKCANNRTVSLFRLHGTHPDPSHDFKVGTDPAQPNGDRYMWAINTNQNGHFYARVKGSNRCKGDFSEVVQAQH